MSGNAILSNAGWINDVPRKSNGASVNCKILLALANYIAVGSICFRRGLRVIAIVFTLIGLMVLSNFAKLYAQCDLPECVNIEPIRATAIVQLPGFPGCDVEIEYTYRICPPPFGVNNIDAYAFSVIGGSPECDALNNYLFDESAGEPNWTGMQWVFREGYNELVRKLFIDAYNNASNKSFFECPNGGVTYNSAWRSCAQVLLARIASPLPYPRYRIALRPCDDRICCLQEMKICYDAVTKTLKETHKWTYGNYGSCGEPPPPIPGTFRLSSCLPWCVE